MCDILKSNEFGRWSWTHARNDTEVVRLQEVNKEGEVSMGKGVFVMFSRENSWADIFFEASNKI